VEFYWCQERFPRRAALSPSPRSRVVVIIASLAQLPSTDLHTVEYGARRLTSAQRRACARALGSGAARRATRLAAARSSPTILPVIAPVWRCLVRVPRRR